MTKLVATMNQCVMAIGNLLGLNFIFLLGIKRDRRFRSSCTHEKGDNAHSSEFRSRNVDGNAQI